MADAFLQAEVAQYEGIDEIINLSVFRTGIYDNSVIGDHQPDFTTGESETDSSLYTNVVVLFKYMILIVGNSIKYV